MALRDLLVRIRGDKTQLDSTLKGAEGSVNNFGNSVKKLGGIIGAAFGVTAIVNFAKEAVKATSTLEGIKKGFEQIAMPGLLDELRKATKGTVSDMQLMSRAVQASNVQIPLKDLAKLLEFASARAIQTGQSVDYLVDSIVLGIGRKSPLILDNLGISAVKLKEKLKGVGDEAATVGDVAKAVGEIASEELTKMGGVAETSAIKTQQIATAWDSVKMAIGKAIIESDGFQNSLSRIKLWLDRINEKVEGNEGKGKNVAADEISFLKSKGLKGQDLSNAIFTKIAEAQEEIDFRKEDNVGLAKEAAQIFGGGAARDKMKANKAEIEELKTSIGEYLKALNAPVLEAEAKAHAEIAKQLEKEAEAAAKTAEAVKKLADAKKDLAFTGSKSTGFAGTGDIKVGPKEIDKQGTALTQYWVQNYLNNSGGNKLRPGPVTSLTADDEANMAKMLEELRLEVDDEVKQLEDTLMYGRDMAIDLGAQLVEGLAAAFAGDNVKDIGRDLLWSFANFMSQLGKMLITTGIGMLAVNPAKGQAMIVGGAAMLVAAGITKGAMNAAARKDEAKSGGGGTYGSSYADPKIQTLNIQFEGKLKGRDIYLSGKRYVEELERGT